MNSGERDLIDSERDINADTKTRYYIFEDDPHQTGYRLHEKIIPEYQILENVYQGKFLYSVHILNKPIRHKRNLFSCDHIYIHSPRILVKKDYYYFRTVSESVEPEGLMWMYACAGGHIDWLSELNPIAYVAVARDWAVRNNRTFIVKWLDIRFPIVEFKTKKKRFIDIFQWC